MGKLPEPASDFLRPDDVTDGTIVKIIGHPEFVPAEQTKYGRDRHIIPIALPNRTEKRWSLNLTSYRTLYKAFGDDGDDWIGKSVKVVRNRENIRGEMRDVLYAEPYNQPQQQLAVTIPNELLGIVNQEALAKLPREEQEKVLRKLSLQE